MAEQHGRRGGYRGGRGGDRGRGRGGGRGGGRGDFRAISEEDGYRAVERIASGFRIGQPRISANAESPDTPEYGPGTVGTEAPFAVNYFELKCQLEEAYQYNVVIAERESWPEGWVFDGRSALYTAGQILPTDDQEMQVELEQGQRSRTYNVKIVHTTVVSMTALERYMHKESNLMPAEAVRVIEILLSHAVSLLPDCILHRKSVFFDTPNTKRDIGSGAEAWMGYYQSVRPCQNGLYLNIDTACGPFYKPLPVTDFLTEILGLQQVPTRLNNQHFSVLKSTLKNLTICLNRGNLKRKVVGLLRPPAECMFTHKELGETSVLDYYKSTNQRLQFPGLPCLDCSKGKRPCYVPPECARIAHAQYVTKITERHQEQMIRFAAQAPDAKENYLNNLVRDKANINQLQKVSDFGVSGTTPNMKELRGRILPSPFLAYKEPACLDVGTDGQWNLGNMTMNFFKGKKLKSWALLSVAEERSIRIGGENGIDAFLRELADGLRLYAVSPPNADLSTPPIVFSHGDDFMQSIDTAISQANAQYGLNPDIILCLFPRRNTRMYRSIKRASDTNIGIPTQCFAGDKAGVGGNRPPRGRQQYCANLALKINVKVGGTNSVLLGSPQTGLPMLYQRTGAAQQRKPFIVLGCDVSHPSPGSQIPSIAAVVGSADPAASRYFSRITHQESREEIIVDMKESVMGLLREFFQHTKGKRPESIIVFRDGVSEGYFAKVLTHEYKAIRDACAEMGDSDADYTPPITYIVIQKRHHTRLFPKSQAAQHRSRNVKPGTVVDSGITSPFGHDFFLCSQAGIQGTVRPAHYHVLVDENNFGSDAIQVMCYWMCYMQCRCTKSISVPAPAHYAHLAALRGRLIAGEETDDETSSIGSGGAGSSSRVGGGHSFGASQSKMYYV